MKPLFWLFFWPFALAWWITKALFQLGAALGMLVGTVILLALLVAIFGPPAVAVGIIVLAAMGIAAAMDRQTGELRRLREAQERGLRHLREEDQ